MKPRIFALLTFFVFVVIFAGAGIISKDFYSMPAYVALYPSEKKQSAFWDLPYIKKIHSGSRMSIPLPPIVRISPA